MRTAMQNAMMMADVRGVAICIEELSDGIALVCDRHVADGICLRSRRIVSAVAWSARSIVDLDEFLIEIASVFLHDCMTGDA